MSENIEDAQRLDVVRFRVGEYIFVCHKSTLLKYPDSKLAECIKQENDTRKSGLDHIVLDRNGKIFGVIMRMMRGCTENIRKDLSESERKILADELDFLRLDQLKEVINVECKKFVPIHLNDASVHYSWFPYNAVFLKAESCFLAFGEKWQDSIRRLSTNGNYEIQIKGYNYHDNSKALNAYEETFSFYLAESNRGEPGYPPLVYSTTAVDIYPDFEFVAPAIRNSKKNLLKFLIAVELYLKSMTVDEILGIEEAFPEMKVRKLEKSE